MRRTTRSTMLTVAVAGLAAPLLLAAPAHAGTKENIRITDTRTITSDTGSATTTLAECEHADSVDVRFQVGGGPIKGVFIGIRDFQCDDGGGLVIRLTASFTEAGSSGSWSIMDSYGPLAGISGSGQLIGVPTKKGGIVDYYVGSITRP